MGIFCFRDDEVSVNRELFLQVKIIGIFIEGDVADRRHVRLVEKVILSDLMDCNNINIKSDNMYRRMAMKRVAIITSSDMGYQGRREDLSGPAIKEIVEREGYQVVSMDILPDDRSMLSKRMVEIADENQAELILTTGGTGFSPRDVMPEATEDITERKVPGIPEAIRAYSMTITNRAMLSRATAGIRKQTLIINLPGSPKAVKESLEYIIGVLGHGIEIMTGEAGNCAR